MNMEEKERIEIRDVWINLFSFLVGLIGIVIIVINPSGILKFGAIGAMAFIIPLFLMVIHHDIWIDVGVKRLREKEEE